MHARERGHRSALFIKFQPLSKLIFSARGPDELLLQLRRVWRFRIKEGAPSDVAQRILMVFPAVPPDLALVELCLTTLTVLPFNPFDVTQTDRRIIDNAMTTLVSAILGPDRVRRNYLTPSRGSSYWGDSSGRLNPLPPVRRVRTTACIRQRFNAGLHSFPILRGPWVSIPHTISAAVLRIIFLSLSPSTSLERPRRLTFSVAHHDQLHPPPGSRRTPALLVGKT